MDESMTYTVACLDIYEDSVKDVLRQHAPKGWNLKMASSYDEASQRSLIEGADFILAGWAPAPGWMFDSPTLRFVQKFGVGYDKIDIAAAREKGIGVAIANGMNAVPVAELVVLFILALYRKFRYMDRTIHEGKWVKAEMRSIAYSLRDKTVGILGLGFIGKEVSKRVQAFEAKVIYYDKFRLDPAMEQQLNVQYVELEQLIATADVVTLHLPYTRETDSLIDAARLARMKPSALLINAARGELVVEADLVHALKNGVIAGAALDVYAKEPIETNNPLLALENAVLTPHVGGTVLDNVAHMARHCFRNIELYLEGKPLPKGDTIVEGVRR
jgi:phosphoglycerate dehydrogenase-like enzyme